MTRRCAGGLAVAFIALSLGAPLVVASAPVVQARPVLRGVGADSGPTLDLQLLETHLSALDAIGVRNGGTRAAGTPGGDESATYLADILESMGFKVVRQAFDAPVKRPTVPAQFEEVAPTPIAFAEGPDFVVPKLARAGSETGRLQAVDVTVPPGPTEGTSGCQPEDFTGFVSGQIALMQLGGCDPTDKLVNARSAGAIAGLVFSSGQPGHTDPEQLHEVPLLSLSLSYPVGAALATETLSTPVDVFVDPGWRITTDTTWNVIGELAGTSDDVIMVGGHYDSVIIGPGINDNGSGVAAILTVADHIRNMPRGLTFRVAMWGAEELGTLGSAHYMSVLPPAEQSRIKAYVNTDMLASPNYAYYVYDPVAAADPSTVSPGSAELTQRFAQWFRDRDLSFDPIWTEGRSDDGAFSKAGIPVGGLFTGAEHIKSADQQARFGGTAGVPFDACYHFACDKLANVNYVPLRVTTTAFDDILLDLLEPTTPPTPAPTPTPVPGVPHVTG